MVDTDSVPKHHRALRAFKDTMTSTVVLLTLRYVMGDKLPNFVTFLKMMGALFVVIYVMECIEDDSSQAFVGVARANVSSQILNLGQ